MGIFLKGLRRPSGDIVEIEHDESLNHISVDDYGAVSIERTDNNGPALDITGGATKDDYSQLVNILNADSEAVLQLSSDGSMQNNLLQDDSTFRINKLSGAQIFVIMGDGAIRVSGLPTEDPHNSGQLWIDVAGGRVLKVSNG